MEIGPGRLCRAATKEATTLHVTIQVSARDILGVVQVETMERQEKGATA